MLRTNSRLNFFFLGGGTQSYAIGPRKVAASSTTRKPPASGLSFPTYVAFCLHHQSCQSQWKGPLNLSFGRNRSYLI